MNSLNFSTGLSGFQLKSGFLSLLIPPLTKPTRSTPKDTREAQDILRDIQQAEREAQDNLLAAKIYQAHYADVYQADDPPIAVGDHIFLDTMNLRREHLGKEQVRVAKLMPRWDGPYTIIHAHPDSSSYT
jgi:hypothetical protein